MSQEALDAVIKRAVADSRFRQMLLDPKRFAEALKGFDLTEDEKGRLRRILLEKAGTSLPFAQNLRERLAK